MAASHEHHSARASATVFVASPVTINFDVDRAVLRLLPLVCDGLALVTGKIPYEPLELKHVAFTRTRHRLTESLDRF